VPGSHAEGKDAGRLCIQQIDALIQFPNRILHLGYADREHPAGEQKKSPNLHVRGFAPVSLQPLTSSFCRQAKPKRLARPGVSPAAEL